MTNPSPLQIYPSTYLACLDVLAFGKIVNSCNGDLSKLLRQYDKLLTFPSHANAGGKYQTIKLSNGEEYVTPDSNAYRVNSIIVSDSIIFWTKDDSVESFCTLIEVVRRTLVGGLHFRLPLRGAIASGSLICQGHVENSKFYNFRQVLIGEPLVDASNAEKNTDWMGCIVLDSCIDKYTQLVKDSPTMQIFDLEYLCEKKYLRKYTVPIKPEGQQKEYWVINWPYGNGQSIPSEETVNKAFPDPDKKVINTIAFLKETTRQSG